jgi:hypothetical protein
VVERRDLAGLQRDQIGLCACVLERLARLDELDTLDHLRGDDRDPLALQRLISHPSSLVRV